MNRGFALGGGELLLLKVQYRNYLLIVYQYFKNITAEVKMFIRQALILKVG